MAKAALAKAKNPVFLALDRANPSEALALAQVVSPHIGGVKVGLELFCAGGPSIVRDVQALGLPVFLDLKLHDIPNTVAGALGAIAPLAPALVTLHASGGRAMLEAARAAVAPGSPTQLIAVTILTSLDEAAIEAVGFDPQRPLGGHVARLAALAAEARLEGCVCSAFEIEALRAAHGPDFLLVVPGLRPDAADQGDQRRTMTPREALDRGADVLVIGRPITGAPDPQAAAQAIARSLG